MFELAVGFAVGALVGWVVPQPAWAKSIVDKLKGFVVTPKV